MKYAVPFCILLAITGCTTISIESRKDPTYSGVLERLYVLINTGELKVRVREGEITKSILISSCFKESIERKFSQIGIDTRARALTGLELNEDELKNDIAAFNSQTIMSMQLKDAVVSSQYGQYTLINGIFDVSVYHTDLDRVIWRSKIKVEGSLGTSGVDNMIDSIISYMKNDDLIAVLAPMN